MTKGPLDDKLYLEHRFWCVTRYHI